MDVNGTAQTHALDERMQLVEIIKRFEDKRARAHEPTRTKGLERSTKTYTIEL